MMRNVMRCAVGLLLVGLMAGCHEMKPREVRVTLDESLRDREGKLASMEVDLIGVSDNELPRWQAMSLKEYWDKIKGPSQSGDVHVIRFTSSDPQNTKSLSQEDPIWARWKAAGVWHLVAIANVTGDREKKGVENTGMVILPLDKARWERLDPIQLVVSAHGLRSESQPKPK